MLSPLTVPTWTLLVARAATTTDFLGGQLTCFAATCPKCTGESFRSLHLAPRHHHLECSGCRTVYCSGPCAQKVARG